MPIHSFIFSKFAISKQDAPMLRFQILSIFYLNFTFTVLVSLFELLTISLKQQSPALFLTTTTCFIGSILCFLFLKKGDHNIAGIIVLIYGHIVINLAAFMLKAPLAGAFGVFCHLSLSFILTDSRKMKIFHNIASFFELVLLTSEILAVFQVTLTEDQAHLVKTGVMALFIAFAYLSIFSFILTNIQADLLKIIQENLEKSENLTKEIVKTVDEKDNFASFLSLEVKSVLSFLNSSIDNLLTTIKDSAQLQILKNAKISGEVLLNLVKNNLDAVKIKTDKLELSYESTHLEDLIRKTFVIHSENLRSKNIFAQGLIDTNIPQNLWLDTGRLLQILINLTSNALKFTPKGGRINIHATWCESEGQERPKDLTKLIKNYKPIIITKPKGNPNESFSSSSCSEKSFAGSENFLEFGYEQEAKHLNNLMTFEKYATINFRGSREFTTLPENWSIKRAEFIKPPSQENIIPHNKSRKSQTGFLKIQVSDSGCGISEKDLPKLFEMKTSPGTGLGLWICKQLCHKMNGDIVISSQINQGTDFMFYISVDNSQLKEVIPPSSRTHKLPPQREKIRALVVDDYDFNRNLHKLLLEREGVQVTLASDGVEAVNKYREKGQGYFDFIFMDINMPKLDGISAVKAIRKWEQEKGFENVDVHLISGDYFDEGELQDLIGNSTTVKFVRKPIEVDKVSRIVEEACKKIMS